MKGKRVDEVAVGRIRIGVAYFLDQNAAGEICVSHTHVMSYTALLAAKTKKKVQRINNRKERERKTRSRG